MQHDTSSARKRNKTGLFVSENATERKLNMKREVLLSYLNKNKVFGDYKVVLEDIKQQDKYEHGSVFDVLNSLFLVLTDDEANEWAKRVIVDGLYQIWPETLLQYCGSLGKTSRDLNKIRSITGQGKKGIPALLGLIDDVDKLVADIIEHDHRCNIINKYNHTEDEYVNPQTGETLYIYHIW